MLKNFRLNMSLVLLLLLLLLPGSGICADVRGGFMIMEQV